MTVELHPGPDWPPVPLEDLWDPDPEADDAWPDEPGRTPEVLALEGLDRLARAEAVAFAQQVRRLAALAVLGRRDPHRADPERFLALELAGTLRLGQGAALTRLAEAERLAEDLPLLLAGLSVGVVFVAQARIVLYESRDASPAVSSELDRRLHTLITLSAARDPEVVGWDGWVATRLRRLVRGLVLEIESELEPAAVAEREERGRQGRRVAAWAEPDGMAAVKAVLPAEQARAFTLGLDALERRQRVADRAAGIERTADQRRADLFALLPALATHALDGTTPPPGFGRSCPTTIVTVHVPVAKALGRSHAPGLLDGHGPIGAEHVRRLLPSATLRRVLVDERTGEPLYLDPELHPPSPAGGTSPTVLQRVRALVPDEPLHVVDEHEPQHDPSAGLARFVELRDPLCTGPGCGIASTRSDLDHHIPWPLGPTSAGNLRPLSRRCHRAKTFTWTVVRHRGGSHTWTSPTGRRYRVPPAWLPPPAPLRTELPHVRVDPRRVGRLLTVPGDLRGQLGPGTPPPF